MEYNIANKYYLLAGNEKGMKHYKAIIAALAKQINPGKYHCKEISFVVTDDFLITDININVIAKRRLYKR